MKLPVALALVAMVPLLNPTVSAEGPGLGLACDPLGSGETQPLDFGIVTVDGIPYIPTCLADTLTPGTLDGDWTGYHHNPYEKWHFVGYLYDGLETHGIFYFYTHGVIP